MKNEMSDLPAPLQAHVRGIQAGVVQLARSAWCSALGRGETRVMTQEAVDAEKADRVADLLRANNGLVERYRKWRMYALALAKHVVRQDLETAAYVVDDLKKAQATDPDLFGDVRDLLDQRPSWRQPITLEECPPGLFDFQGELCMKTEYRVSNEDLRCEAYIVASGEFFCGPAGTGSKQPSLMVVPVPIPAFWAQAQNAGTAMGREFRPTHRHRKRGSSYELVTDKAPYQESQPGERPPYDDEPMAVYRTEEGEIYVRRAEGFNDGRFERL